MACFARSLMRPDKSLRAEGLRKMRNYYQITLISSSTCSYQLKINFGGHQQCHWFPTSSAGDNTSNAGVVTHISWATSQRPEATFASTTDSALSFQMSDG